MKARLASKDTETQRAKVIVGLSTESGFQPHPNQSYLLQKRIGLEIYKV